MANAAGATPTLLIKKMGGLLLIVVGFVLAASGWGSDSRAFKVFGVLAAGLVFLMLKIMRRNAP